MLLFFRFIVYLYVSLVASQELEESFGHILASKTILNNMIVEKRPLTVEYALYNVGKTSAIDVHLEDSSFPNTSFILKSGSLHVTWPRLSPGSNVTHACVLEPIKSGYFNFTAAEIKYKPSEGKEEIMGYTSAPYELNGIMPFKDFDRKFSPHYLDWLAFCIMCLPSLAFPFVLWYKSKSKYENFSSKSKKN